MAHPPNAGSAEAAHALNREAAIASGAIYGEIKMHSKLICTVGALGLCGTIATASATIVDVNYAGTVHDGTDGAGIFGPVGGDLSGKSFSLDFLFDTNKGVDSSNPVTLYSVYGGTGYSTQSPALGTTLEIDGVKSKIYDGNVVGQLLGANGNNGAVNQQYHQSLDSKSDSIYAGVYNTADSITGDIPATIDVPFSFVFSQIDTGFGYATLFDGVNATTANLTPTTLTYSIPATSTVPEPSTWALMLVGFAGLGWAAYRRKSSAALA
jgi:hypothetical protein